MFPAILMFCCIGIYSVNSLPTDVMFIGFFGLVGYALVKLGFEPAPLLLGFVLGRLMEENLRRALIISRGELTTFIERPISAGLLAVALILLVIAFLPAVQKEREEIFVE
jgi:putative tricarboxylic transport membrane protein